MSKISGFTSTLCSTNERVIVVVVKVGILEPPVFSFSLWNCCIKACREFDRLIWDSDDKEMDTGGFAHFKMWNNVGDVIILSGLAHLRRLHYQTNAELRTLCRPLNARRSLYVFTKIHQPRRFADMP
jgi:hypothetical protein